MAATGEQSVPGRTSPVSFFLASMPVILLTMLSSTFLGVVLVRR